MLHEFRNESDDKITSVDVNTLNDLCRIYSAENYCLRRIPRLVNLIESRSLANLLSDHVSKIMDRLNLLDEIFEEFKSRPSTMKVFDSQSHSMRIFLLKDDTGNQKLVSELIKASQYRYSLYELLLNSSNEKAKKTIYSMLVNSLDEEESFYKELINIKRQMLSMSKISNIQVAENA